MIHQCQNFKDNLNASAVIMCCGNFVQSHVTFLYSSPQELIFNLVGLDTMTAVVVPSVNASNNNCVDIEEKLLAIVCQVPFHRFPTNNER